MITAVQLYTMNKDLEKTLKAAIVESGLSVYRLAKDAGVNEHSIAWFVEGKRTLRLDTASKIARRLGLELTEVKGIDHAMRAQNARRKSTKGR